MHKWWRENRTFVVFLTCFGFFRLAIADWNPIPSGSMRPTLLEGDVVLVNRVAYDLKVPLTDWSLVKTGEPKRGDVVVFFSPQDRTRLIKRLVALPGDTLEMRHERLRINGRELALDAFQTQTQPLASGGSTQAIHALEYLADSPHAVQFLPEVRARRDFGPIRVPENHYFFLGDNRDNSADSRYIGMVPRANLVGRAHHVLVSANMLDVWQPRWSRWGSAIE